MRRLLILSVIVLALLCSQTAKADLVINGDFQPLPPGVPSPWVNNAYGVGWGVGNFAAAFSYFPGTLSQTISTVPDAWYTLDFWLIHDSPGGTQNIPPYFAAIQVFQATWDGSVIFTAPASNFATGAGYQTSPSIDYTWALFEVDAQATGAYTTLGFSGQDTGGYYFLDNVSVNERSTPVPEPATLLLLGSGLAGLGGIAWRRHRK
jgi:hypothetical protein